MHLSDKLNPTGKKKILALDGGGIKGVVSIEILAKIEQLLREREGKPDLVLADYFDFIAGTSTGALIGTAISIGMTVGEIRSFYHGSGGVLTVGRDEEEPNLHLKSLLGLTISFHKTPCTLRFDCFASIASEEYHRLV